VSVVDHAWIGCDVGSTAVKVVALDAGASAPAAMLYARHGTRQAEALLGLLEELEEHHPELFARARLCFTGSGGRPLAQRAGSRYLQEVNAVALATERLYPDAGSIVDLGGQDAKIILWQRDPASGRTRKSLSMNDKCAGGTGAVIDRIARKLGLAPEALQRVHADGHRLHPVAARCGVFAETDVNSLQKQGVPAEELIASLFEAIVQQNLSVLARGATLQPPVLLLGGPHAFLPGLAATWRRALHALWKERGMLPPAGMLEAVRVPAEACYFAALGAIFHARSEAATRPEPAAAEARGALAAAVRTLPQARGLPGLIRAPEELDELRELARQAPVPGLAGCAGLELEGVIGLDAGSTSTKAVLLDAAGTLLTKSYRLSAGDPLRDAQAVLTELAQQARATGCRLRIRGLGVTGYAKDLLGAFLGADLVLVETVAHANSGRRVFPDVDAIVDVGGQDIKVLVLREGRVRDFRLNSQCSAGNGFFLQSTAERFRIPLEAFADHAFRAARVPEFNFGCAVFLESDIVNFQQLGWQPEEILAGLARVLPKNIWLYVVGEPNLRRVGRSFLLQGGTQRNLAAVKAQLDFIRERVPEARVRVHPYAGEAGAIGVALELLKRGGAARGSDFIGLEAVAQLRVHSRQDESTRCGRCPNHCQRTFLEAVLPDGSQRAFIAAPCEGGRRAKGEAGPEARGEALPAPDFALRGARVAFHPAPRVPVGAARATRGLERWAERCWIPGRAGRARRETVRIGIPRALNLFQTAPFFTAYLHSLGVAPERIHFSGTTTEELFRRGVRRGAIDNCFPSKLALAHVYDLLYRVRPDWIFFPILISLPQEVRPALDACGCPSSQATPEVVKAAFMREGDLFARRGVRYLDPVLHWAEPSLFEREMLRFWGPRLGVTRAENRRALRSGLRAWEEASERELRRPALAEIRRLERDRRVGIVVLGRPYHDDPGLNHGIFRELNQRGYPIFTVGALPRDLEFLNEALGNGPGAAANVFDISDVWVNSYSANSNQKLWAAKVVAAHPNLVALDVSSFRCGHDAPIHATVEAILERTRTPYFTFHDVDENRPTGAIRLRVETIDYFLREYEARGLRGGAEAAVEMECATGDAPADRSAGLTAGAGAR
jgi:predicted CoA-substrate-specific enzyme activase